MSVYSSQGDAVQSKDGSMISGHMPKRPVVIVIDGQGGGFGAAIIK